MNKKNVVSATKRSLFFILKSKKPECSKTYYMYFGRISFYFVFFLTKLYASGHSESIDMPLKKKIGVRYKPAFFVRGGWSVRTLRICQQKICFFNDAFPLLKNYLNVLFIWLMYKLSIHTLNNDVEMHTFIHYA